MLLDALEMRDMLDNTIIIFTSDHGEMLGDHGLFQKQVPYEPSIHIPLIVAGPDIARGVVSDALVEMQDLNPTICALANVAPAPDMDARSFDGVLSGERTEHRQDILIALSNFRGIRNRRHKFVENSDDMPELYDLINDPKKRLTSPMNSLIKLLPCVIGSSNSFLCEGQFSPIIRK